MKNKLLFIFTIYCVVFHTSLNAQTFEWAAKDRWSALDGGKYVCADNLGNVYVVGNYKPSGNRPDPSLPKGSFLSKYNSQGSLLWSITGLKEEPRLTLDIYQNPVITGGDTLGRYFAKYDHGGNLLMKKYVLPPFANSSGASIRGISFDKYDNYYLMGTIYHDTIYFGTFSLKNPEYSQLFYIAKFNAAGQCLWAKQSNSGHIYQHTCLNVDAQGNSYIAGDFIGTLTLDSASITSSSFNGFIAKYDSLGNEKWLFNVNGNGQEWVSALSADQNGNVYAVGYYDGPLNLGNTNLVPYGPVWVSSFYMYWNDAFILKLNKYGNVKWAKTIGGINKDFAEGISVGNNSNIYVSGSFAGQSNFDSISLSNNGFVEPFVAKYDSLGNIKWAVQMGGNGAAAGIDVDSVNNIFVTGSFGNTMQFGGNPLYGKPNSMFITKMVDQTIEDLKEISNNSIFSIYPNPSQGIFTITYESKQTSGKINLEIKNVFGVNVYREINTFTNNIFSKELNLQMLAKGIYFIEIIADKKTVQKIVLD